MTLPQLGRLAIKGGRGPTRGRGFVLHKNAGAIFRGPKVQEIDILESCRHRELFSATLYLSTAEVWDQKVHCEAR